MNIDNASKYVLLFSADWFYSFARIVFPSWRCQYLPKFSAFAKQGAKRIIGNAATYWEADVSLERVERVVIEFVSDVRSESSFKGDFKNEVENFFRGEPVNNSDDNALFILDELTNAFLVEAIEESQLDISQELKEYLLFRCCEKSADLSDEVEKESLNSCSEWDGYLRSLTPDIPLFLSDLLVLHLKDVKSFQVLWGRIGDMFDKESVDKLADWYVRNAEILTDGEFEVPDFMKTK